MSRLLPAEAKICNFTHKLRVDEDISGCQISVYIVHLRQVLHPIGDPSHHAHQLHHLELAIVDPEEGVQAAVLHVLCDDHDGGGLGHYTLQKEENILENCLNIC